MNTKLKNILLCYASGMGIKSISSAFDISRNTVRRYVRMYQDSGIPAEKLPSLSDARLQELFAIPGARERQPSERQIRIPKARQKKSVHPEQTLKRAASDKFKRKKH